MCAEIAHELGQDPAWSERLRLAARLHDIGKVAIPDSILLKPGPLTPAEFEVMKTHTTLGARILSGSTSPLVQLAEEVALNHHERWDALGYPNQIGATDVPPVTVLDTDVPEIQPPVTRDAAVMMSHAEVVKFKPAIVQALAVTVPVAI